MKPQLFLRHGFCHFVTNPLDLAQVEFIIWAEVPGCRQTSITECTGKCEHMPEHLFVELSRLDYSLLLCSWHGIELEEALTVHTQDNSRSWSILMALDSVHWYSSLDPSLSTGLGKSY